MVQANVSTGARPTQAPRENKLSHELASRAAEKYRRR